MTSAGAEHILLKAFDREIVQDGDLLEFRKRPSGASVVALAIAVVAACFHGIGVALRSAGKTARALATFVIRGAGLMAIVGLLSLAGAIVLLQAPRLRVLAQVDRAARNVRICNRVVPFGEIRRFAMPPSSERMRSLSVETTGQELIRIWTATPPQFDALEALASQLNEVLGKVDAAALPEPGAATTAAAIDQRFRTQVILCIGLLWTGGGFFLFRGVSFASRLEPMACRFRSGAPGL